MHVDEGLPQAGAVALHGEQLEDLARHAEVSWVGNLAGEVHAVHGVQEFRVGVQGVNGEADGVVDAPV